MISPNAQPAIKKTGNVAAAPKQQPVENRAMQILMGPDMQARLQALLTDKSMLDRFIGVLTGVMKSNQKLSDCTPDSLVGAMLKSAFLKLEPNNVVTQQCWLIPRWNDKIGKYECSWEIGYKGLIELASRSGVFSAILFSEIHERDQFDVDFGSGIVVHKIPDKDDPDRFNRGKVLAYWAQWIGKDGERGRPVIISVDGMNAFAEQYAQSLKGEGRKYSPWTTAFDQMALKTVIKRALKSAPISTEDYRRALENDGMTTSGKEYGLPEKKPTSATADILSSPPSEFIEAEVSDPEPAKPEPAAAQPGPATPETDEQHRLDMIQKVQQRIEECKAKGMDLAELVMKLGMPPSMVPKASIDALMTAWRKLQ